MIAWNETIQKDQGDVRKRRTAGSGAFLRLELVRKNGTFPEKNRMSDERKERTSGTAVDRRDADFYVDVWNRREP